MPDNDKQSFLDVIEVNPTWQYNDTIIAYGDDGDVYIYKNGQIYNMSAYCGVVNMMLEKNTTLKDLKAIAKILGIQINGLNKGDICRAVAVALGTEDYWNMSGWDEYYDVNSY